MNGNIKELLEAVHKDGIVQNTELWEANEVQHVVAVLHYLSYCSQRLQSKRAEFGRPYHHPTRCGAGDNAYRALSTKWLIDELVNSVLNFYKYGVLRVPSCIDRLNVVQFGECYLPHYPLCKYEVYERIIEGRLH